MNCKRRSRSEFPSTVSSSTSTSSRPKVDYGELLTRRRASFETSSTRSDRRGRRRFDNGRARRRVVGRRLARRRKRQPGWEPEAPDPGIWKPHVDNLWSMDASQKQQGSVIMVGNSNGSFLHYGGSKPALFSSSYFLLNLCCIEILSSEKHGCGVGASGRAMPFCPSKPGSNPGTGMLSIYSRWASGYI